MPLTMRGESGTRKSTPSRTSLPTGMTYIKNMGALDTFRFASNKKTANSGVYLRVNSKENKAINLKTGKVFNFAANDYGKIESYELVKKA